MRHIRTIPVLRSFDEKKAREFYVDFLGFTVDFEHRFEPHLPLFLGLSRDGIMLYVSEHHGDGTPGTHVTLQIEGVQAFHAELSAKNYGFARPGLERPEWGGTMLSVTDPAGNRLSFWEDD